jgi:exodeoxyribonuclease-3
MMSSRSSRNWVFSAVSTREALTSVVTFNANGIRAAQRKGFFEWMRRESPDVVCIQETKAQEHQLVAQDFYPEGYFCVYNDAERKGYSGTAIYSRVTPRSVVTRLGWDPLDNEGRYTQFDYKGISIISLYVPSGSSSDAALEKKLAFMDRFYDHLQTLRRKRRQFIICADWNTCHKEIDLKNWRPNQKNSGFCRLSAPGWIVSTIRSATLIRFGSWTRARIVTPGGRIAGRPGPGTSAGVSTIR